MAYPSRFNFYAEFTRERLAKLEEEDAGKPEREKRIMSHQHKALREMKIFFEREEAGHGLVVMPTGTGKSLIALLAPYYLGIEGQVMLITPSVVIKRQLAADAQGQGSDRGSPIYVKRGIIPSDNRKYLPRVNVQSNSHLIQNNTADMIIANYQQFGPRAHTTRVDEEDVKLDDNYFPRDDVDLIIVDEAHHYPAKTLKTIIQHYWDKKCLFLTATPFKDEINLQWKDNTVKRVKSEINLLRNMNTVKQVKEIYRFPRSDAETNDIIRKTQWRAVQKPVSPQTTKKTKEEKAARKKTKEEKAAENAFALKAYQEEIELTLVQVLKEHPHRQAMALTTTIKGCKDSVARLTGLGIKAGAHYGNERPEYENLRKFRKGEIQVLLICGKLLEGFDHNKVSVCAFLNVTSSIVRFSQFSGRCIRIDRNLPIEHEAILIGPEELNLLYKRMAEEDTQPLPEELPVEDPADEPDDPLPV